MMYCYRRVSVIAKFMQNFLKNSCEGESEKATTLAMGLKNEVLLQGPGQSTSKETGSAR